MNEFIKRKNRIAEPPECERLCRAANAMLMIMIMMMRGMMQAMP
jgi:hypothetical protein